VHVLGAATDAVRHSRFPSFVDLGTGEGVQDRWLDWLATSAPAGAVVLAASDAGVEMTARHRARLVELGLLPMELNDEVALVMLDKQRTSELAAALDVPCPRTLRVTSADEVGGELAFPLGLKPVHSYRFHAYFKEKIFVVRDEEELRERLDATSQLGLAMIATELIEGPDEGIRTYCAYLDENAEVMCGALSVLNDLRGFLEYRRRGELTTSSYLRSLARPHHLMTMAWDDPMPAIAWHWGLVRKRLSAARR
jgi:hypothetical protein